MFGPLWHDACWVPSLTVSDGDARNFNEFGRQADEAMPEADAQMDVPDEDMEDYMPPGLPPRPPPPRGAPSWLCGLLSGLLACSFVRLTSTNCGLRMNRFEY